jgi:Predicted acyl-CoA transferases/carnitine dehydratase
MGPLTGIKVVEFAGLGPVPFCCMLLSDMGAEVIRIDRMTDSSDQTDGDARSYVLGRNRRSIAVDLKSKEGRELVKRLICGADVLVEGFRPGVMERLGLGPVDCDDINPRLIYGRMTGWGQDGPLSSTAGHDINFISLSGLLHCIGYKDSAPVPPLNLIGDFGGGALYLAFGIVCALVERSSSGKGQIIDAAMIDGVSSLMASLFSAIARGDWKNARGSNLLDGGAPWYGVYETKDGKYVSIGSVEERFYRELLERLGLDQQSLPSRDDRSGWAVLRKALADVFITKTRAEWCSILEGTDACFSPVLDPWEAPGHQHLAARDIFVDYEGVVQPRPAPRFSRTAPGIKRHPPVPGEHSRHILTELGYSEAEVEALIAAGVVEQR